MEYSNTTLAAADEIRQKSRVDEPSTPSYPPANPVAPPLAGPSRRIGFLAIVPGLVTVITSWGLATALLGWLFSTRITEHASNEDRFFQGALVAVERGVAPIHNVDGSVVAQSKLYGLTISSLSNTVVGATIPVIFGLFAFLVAVDWLRAQDAGQTAALPTPPQYGMMVHMFGAASIKTIYDYWTFFRKPMPAAAPPVAALRKCFTALLILLTFNYAIIGGDLWLHLRTTSFIHRRVTPIPASDLTNYALGAAINTTRCPGPTSSVNGDVTAELPAGYAYNCQTDRFTAADTGGGTADVNGWGDTSGLDDQSLVGFAVTTMRGQYTDNQVYLVGDLAIVSRPNLTSAVDGAVFETLALKSQCQPADCNDVGTDPGRGNFSCTAFSPPWDSYRYDSLKAPQNVIQRFNPGDKSLMTASYPLGSNLNPTGAIAVISYATTETVQQRLGNGSMPGWQQSGIGNGGGISTFIAQCTVTAYHVNVKLSNLPSQSLTIVSDPVLADFNTTSALTPAFETDSSLSVFMMNYLADTFQYADVSDQDAFISSFSRNLSVAALSLASPLVLARPITDGLLITADSASRYEWAPLFFYTGILYIYGLFALGLCVVIAFASSPTVMRGNESVKTAHLLHLRLTDPMVVIADRFVDADAGKGSVEQNAQEIYRAAEDDSVQRLGAGHALNRRKTFGIEVI
ncbi:hypothetical protein MVEN_01033200 [Mycena venus]|uniref:Uncharacterized protein n=1 Tax=Mycena venus TaxID=2733690 RepID=A0A8H6YDF5_9AGAR|nr:hypothetical protein MVEN_01033200 [Mycena venus]